MPFVKCQTYHPVRYRHEDYSEAPQSPHKLPNQPPKPERRGGKSSSEPRGQNEDIGSTRTEPERRVRDSALFQPIGRGGETATLNPAIDRTGDTHRKTAASKPIRRDDEANNPDRRDNLAEANEEPVIITTTGDIDVPMHSRVLQMYEDGGETGEEAFHSTAGDAGRVDKTIVRIRLVKHCNFPVCLRILGDSAAHRSAGDISTTGKPQQRRLQRSAINIGTTATAAALAAQRSCTAAARRRCTC